MTKMPGNWINVSGPLVTSVPPSIVVQNGFCASTSFTARWMCPSATPMSFGGASCPKAEGDKKKASDQAIAGKSRFFMTHSVSIRAASQKARFSRRGVN